MVRKIYNRIPLCGLAVLILQAKAQANMMIPVVMPLAFGLGQLKSGLGACLGIITIIGFMMAVIKMFSGAQAMGKGDTEAGKQAIISAVFFAAAGTIVGILFAIFGLQGAEIKPTFD